MSFLPARFRFAAASTALLSLASLLALGGCFLQTSQGDDEEDEPFIISPSDGGEGGGDVGLADAGDDPAGATGAACSSAGNCLGDTCLSRDEYPGGYCTTEGCSSGECESRGGVCAERVDGPDRCLDRCEGSWDCRDGYACRPFSGADGFVCLPEREGPPDSFERTRQVLDVRCDPSEQGNTASGTRYRFEFSIADEANAFTMVPYVTSGMVRPVELETPSEQVDLQNDYRHHNSRLQAAQQSGAITDVGTYGVVGLDWAVQVPYAPRFSDYAVGGGEYTLELVADEEQPCVYVVDNRGNQTLDLNFYFVGANGRDAESGRDDEDLAEAVQVMDDLYGQADIDIGEKRYRDVPDDIVAQYRNIESSEDANRLTAYGEPPNDSLDGHLSVDVFLVDDLNVGRQATSNVLGMSTGIPGAPGLHGHARNGLVFQTTDLGRDNEHVGHIMAHEIAHYLGLRHTTEVVHGTSRGEQFDNYLGSTDPIEDTPVCENIGDHFEDRDPTACPDYYNLMFPTAPLPQDGQDVGFTDGQSQVLRWNPMVK